jgi:predicted negative regulator of RcsB-dependent stress response
MTEVERMYGNTSRQFREFGEWLAGLTAAIGAVTQKRVEQPTAQLNEVDDRIRLTQENSALREEIRTLRIAEIEAQKQQPNAATEAQKEQRNAATHEAARQATELITTFRDAVLGWISAEVVSRFVWKREVAHSSGW